LKVEAGAILPANLLGVNPLATEAIHGYRKIIMVLME
jgi:hypothetical protein